MQVAVDLDGELGRGAEEIEDVHTNWMLTAKDRTVRQTPPQPRPEHHFRLGHRPAKTLGPLQS